MYLGSRVALSSKKHRNEAGRQHRPRKLSSETFCIANRTASWLLDFVDLSKGTAVVPEVVLINYRDVTQTHKYRNASVWDVSSRGQSKSL